VPADLQVLRQAVLLRMPRRGKEAEAGARHGDRQMKPIRCIVDVMPVFKAGDPQPEGYNEWHEWARVQHKAGLRQKKCPNCGLWNYPQEFSSKAIEIVSLRESGCEYVQNVQTALICQACATVTVK
jgi:hypothetical protein